MGDNLIPGVAALTIKVYGIDWLLASKTVTTVVPTCFSVMFNWLPLLTEADATRMFPTEALKGAVPPVIVATSLSSIIPVAPFGVIPNGAVPMMTFILTTVPALSRTEIMAEPTATPVMVTLLPTKEVVAIPALLLV